MALTVCNFCIVTEAEILESVAEAIWLVDAPGYANGVVPWGECPPGQRALVMRRAAAAIRTMRAVGLEAFMRGE